MKRLKTIMLATMFMLLIFPLTVSAAGNKYKTGAAIPSYENTVTINIDSERFDRDFLEALDEAGEKASRTTQYKIIIPPGVYTIGHQYRVPSNTHIYARGAAVYADGTRTAVLMGAPDRKSENIILEGGTWSTAKQKAGTIIGAPFRFIGVKNLIMKDMTIKTNRKGHIIEVADMYGFTVEGCSISGNNLDSREPYLNIQPKEAIQLDVATRAAVPGYGTTSNMYNGKGCHRVLIRNNKFYNCARGVGSHSYASGAEKRPYTYITVTGNVFKNLLAEAVHGQDWRDTTISKNTIEKCRQAGVYLYDAYNVRVTGNKVTDMRKYSGARKRNYDPKGKYGTGVLVRKSQNLLIDGNQFAKVYKAGVIQEDCRKITEKGNKTRSIRK